MKKTLTILLLTMVFYGCKKPQNNQRITPPTILGKWTKDKTIFWQFVNGAKSPVTEADNTDSNNYIAFNIDGTGVISNGDNGSYVLTDFNYSLNGSYLTFTEGKTLKKDSISLTNSSLYIHDDLIVKIAGGDTYEYVSNDYYSR